MDTLTHALSGALVGRLLAPRRSAAATPAVVPPAAWQAVATGAVAATFPDLDFILGYVSELAYLRGHRGVTHSIVLLPIWGLLLAALMSRLFARDRTTLAGHGFGAFYLLACAALAIHIAGDLITQFGTMILAPFSDRRFGLGTTFIIDLPFTGIILAGLAASVLWRHSRVPAAIALVALAGWVGVGAVGRGEAIEAAHAYAAAHGIDAVAVDAAPRPASPFNWTAIVFDGERYHYAHINTRRSEPLVAAPDDSFIRRFSAPYQPVAMARWEVQAQFGEGDAGELARSVWTAEDFAFYRWFAMFPLLDHVDNGSERVCAGFRDLRFEMPGRDELPFRYGLCSEARTAGAGWRLYERVSGGRRWIDVD
ncbi:MAG: metal-dependent hydrolase [Thauera phenolivorans]|uniref:Metal-dependent hydrolase n=1 Tax=Thauera phenolivorans TaxID=1792543 RepID=A0A7X7LXZ6_9RHOO|nr:metal-dependent hydrolase [Thauera phenolivorans]